MTAKEEFAERFAATLGRSWEELSKTWRVDDCDCGLEYCEGLVMTFDMEAALRLLQAGESIL